MRLTNRTLAIIGILSLAVLTWALFIHRPSTTVPDSQQPPGPSQELDSFLNDRMDYGLPFSRILVEKRITRAREIAARNPAFEPKSRIVTDSLRARLARKAKIG